MMNKKGFTLVEILVAIFLTGLVMAGLVGLWVSSENFMSSDKTELLFKNMFSIAEMKLHKDISEAAAVNVGQMSCGDGTVQFLTLFKNYSPDKDGGSCLILTGGATDVYTVVQYTFGKDASTGALSVYRIEKSYSCSYTSNAAVCIGVGGKPETLINNVSGTMSSTPSGVCVPGKPCGGPSSFGFGVPYATLLDNRVTVFFSAVKKVGKNNRPVQLDFRKSFAFSGGA